MIVTVTNHVERPRLVAQRLERLAARATKCRAGAQARGDGSRIVARENCRRVRTGRAGVGWYYLKLVEAKSIYNRMRQMASPRGNKQISSRILLK